VLRVSNDEKFINQKLGEIVQDCIIVDPSESDPNNAFKYNPNKQAQGIHQVNIPQQAPPLKAPV